MKIYLVGGAIRDKLLDIQIKDRDWVVVGATPETLLNLKFKKVGKDFPVFLHPYSKEEYSLARIDRKCGYGYTGFKTYFSEKITLEEDLIRRDLTINAIAQDKHGSYIDFFNGLKDLKNRVLRHISPAFCEDPLRIFRVARFSATLNHLGFYIAKETMQLMIDMVKNGELMYLTQDRIWKETEKALNTRNPHVYFQILYHCNALSIAFPEINMACQYNLKRVYRYYKIFNFKSNVFLEIARISNLNQEIDIRFSYLCNIICQVKRCYFDNCSFEFYDLISKKLIEMLCKRLCIPAYIKNLSIIFSAWFKFLSVIHLQSSENIIMFFNKVDAWRKPYRINKLSVLIDLYMFSFMNIEVKNICQGDFLKNTFNVSNKISTKSILCSGFSGIEIRNELVRLRVIAINTFRKNF
ncbi:MAG: tRNA CCA-pyrophosphorylase [Buchnera aphidicola (Melaphis rhois)]